MIRVLVADDHRAMLDSLVRMLSGEFEVVAAVADGLAAVTEAARLEPVVKELKSLGVRVSLFMDPVPEAMAAAAGLGADRVELYTEPYARAFGAAGREAVLGRYAQAARAAQRSGLGVNAGHDLNLDNLPVFLRSVPEVLEVSIGHALISDALELGLAEAVRRYLEAIRRGNADQGTRAS